MDNGTNDELQEARRPIASLVSKSEKAQRKLPPGTWQHAMLRDNLKALRITLALMDNATGEAGCTPDVLQTALESLASIKSKTEKAQAKFSPGTSQHALLRNRFKALCAAEAMIKSKLITLHPSPKIDSAAALL